MPARYHVPAERVASRTLDGEAVIINLDSGVYFGLNPPATALWNLLEDGPRSSESLSSALADAHQTELDAVLGDVRFFLEGLERDGLLEPTDADEVSVDAVAASGPYLAPIAERYDKLDDLMLSGE